MSSLDHDSELPGYSTRLSVASRGSAAQRTENTYALENSKGRKWLFLIVKSRAINSTSPPLYMEHDIISGRVEIDLDKSESSKGVVLSVQAGTTAVGQEEILFLYLTQDLWLPDGGKSSSAKLNGKYSWPFSITLPREVPVTETKGKKSPYRLPPTFSERASPAYIDYRLQVTVKRGALRVDQTLTTSFGYTPSSSPDPPSPLRQLAYKEGGALVGPEGDPEGWKVLSPIHIKGTLFDTRDVDVECILAIATPLCYAAGSPLPLRITFTSADSQALDILSAPTAIRLHLVRSMATGSDAIDDDVTRRSNNFFLESVGQAFFWPSNEGAPEEGKRTLQGEVEIKKTVKPSFRFPRFTIRYTLDLLPFKTPGFVSPIVEPDATLLSEKVTIVTQQAPGISPRSHAPPGYEKPQGGDYNKSMGLLENGNQRFYHHGH